MNPQNNSEILTNGPADSAGQQSQVREWVVSGRDLAAGKSKTRLLFNAAITASASNRATRVHWPAPIVIERLLPVPEKHQAKETTRSSMSFATLTEESLCFEIQLANRDLRRRRFESLTKSSAKGSQEPPVLETGDVEMLQPQKLEAKKSWTTLKAANPKKREGQPGTKLSVLRSQKVPMPRIKMNQIPEKDLGCRNGISSSLSSRLSEQSEETASGISEQPSEALLEDLLEDTAQASEADRQPEDMAEWRLQAPTLESMLLRIEEMQRDQEEVRRRHASISYSGPSYRDGPGAAGPKRNAKGSRPVSPQLVKVTRPVLRQSTAANVILEEPVQTGNSFLSEKSLTEKGSRDKQQPRSSIVLPGPVHQSRRTVLSVPASMLRNIRRHREDYLRVEAHEAAGTSIPWAVNSLAEELLSDALADVAREFDDVLGEYAEVVFTSEFLEPVQSPPASATR